MLNSLCWDDSYTIAQGLEHRWLRARQTVTAGSKLLMFADDKTVYSSDPSKARSEAKLSSALEILNNHLGSLGMQINTDKTVVMQIHPKRATGSQQQQQRQQLQITLSKLMFR